MNRHSVVFTARSDVNSVLMGPFTLDRVKEFKHKYSLLIHNFGNVNLVFTPQYSVAGTWTTCLNVGSTSPAGPYSLVARAERTVEFIFISGNSFRIVGYGVNGVTEGRIEMIEVDFESNINDR